MSKPQFRSKISVVVITLNEEKNIDDCLRSVRWADEIIVVDSFSTDTTVSLARNYTSHVIQRRWPGMVGIQRNEGLEMAASEWVLFLDADERVTEDLRAELEALVGREGAGRFSGGRIPRKNYFFGKWLRCSYPDYTSRFLRKGAGRYNEIPGRGFDTMVFSSGDVYDFRHPLVHMTGETLAQRIRKLDFDSGLQADEKFSAGKTVGGFGLLLHPAVAFLRTYILKKGLLDGTPGFIYSCLAAFNTFMKYARLWEKHRK